MGNVLLLLALMGGIAMVSLGIAFMTGACSYLLWRVNLLGIASIIFFTFWALIVLFHFYGYWILLWIASIVGGVKNVPDALYATGFILIALSLIPVFTNQRKIVAKP